MIVGGSHHGVSILILSEEGDRVPVEMGDEFYYRLGMGGDGGDRSVEKRKLGTIR